VKKSTAYILSNWQKAVNQREKSTGMKKKGLKCNSIQNKFPPTIQSVFIKVYKIQTTRRVPESLGKNLCLEPRLPDRATAGNND